VSQDGVIAISLGVEIVDGPTGVRLRGPAGPVAETLDRLRALKNEHDGYTARLGDWTLIVDDLVSGQLPPRTVSLPGRAWNIAASVLRDAAFGDYTNPMDFGDVGYLNPRPEVDIGVEIVGEPPAE
jgi:hypothetical protein